MLQQTQVDRVLPKYQSFLKKFPSFKALASASLQSVLVEWKGLGYNRRALGLKRAAEAVMKEHNGKVPRDYTSLLKLPGIGPYTAHAVRAFAWNEPDTFIETNIRGVYIHHFFPKAKKVDDTKLLPFIEKTLDTKNPREWYYALMDYGTYLKKTIGNASRKSASYSKQSKFKGSHRELRALVLHMITQKKKISVKNIATAIHRKETDVVSVVAELKKDGFVKQNKSSVHIA
jgi:A/G-specific adenine glycosylase